METIIWSDLVFLEGPPFLRFSLGCNLFFLVLFLEPVRGWSVAATEGELYIEVAGSVNKMGVACL